MSSLEQQFRKEYAKYFDKLIKSLEPKIKRYCLECQNIFRGYVPVDTETLKESITCHYVKTLEGIEVIITIPNKELDYQDKSINAIKLAMILQAGQRGNIRLKRTRSNVYAKAKSPTRNWITKAFNLCKKRLEEFI